ncbi:hypothetical protein AB0F85_19830 [Nocardia fluminea]|uniref:hypothetical protein n=1 Tax=Nocardia fluminea TaxID=134984 RepID=UPI0033C16314
MHWQSYPREFGGATEGDRAVLADPGYAWPARGGSGCTTDCDFSKRDGYELGDNHICRGLAHGCDLNC